MSLLTPYKGYSDRLLSPKIWGNLPIEHWERGDGGRFIFDDFNSGTAGVAPGGTATQYNGWHLFGPTGVTFGRETSIIQSSSTATEATRGRPEHGILVVSGNDADNDDSYMQSARIANPVTGNSFIQPQVIAFEIRMALASIANNAAGFFVGLSDCSMDGTGLTNNTAELETDQSFLGFQVLCADGDAVDSCYQKASQTKQTVQSGVHVPVANEFVKLGFLLHLTGSQGGHPASKRCKFFVNNTEQTSYITSTNIEAATFPNGDELSVTFATLNGDGSPAEHKVYVDWIACGTDEG